MKRFTAAQVDRLFYNSPEIQVEMRSNAAFHRVVALVERAHGILPGDETPPESIGLPEVEAAAMQLLRTATHARMVVTVERRALQPLAMGHAEYVVSTRPARALNFPFFRPKPLGEPPCTCLTSQLGPDFCERHAA